MVRRRSSGVYRVLLLKLPIYWVVALVSIEEVVKSIIGYFSHPNREMDTKCRTGYELKLGLQNQREAFPLICSISISTTAVAATLS